MIHNFHFELDSGGEIPIRVDASAATVDTAIGILSRWPKMVGRKILNVSRPGFSYPELVGKKIPEVRPREKPTETVEMFGDIEEGKLSEW